MTDTGRSTKIKPIQDALQHVNRGWKRINTGDVLQIQNNENRDTIHFVDGDVILPPSLTSPRTTPWRSIFRAFKSGSSSSSSTNTDEGSLPTEDKINTMMRHFAAEQSYVPKKMFSCMQYTLDMYMQKKT